MRKKVTMGDLGTIITGNTPPRSMPELYGDYTPFVKATDISESEKYTYTPEECYSKEGHDRYIRSLVPKGSTCVVTIGSIGKKMTMAHCDLFINQAMNAIIPNENFDNEFVYYAVKNVLSNIKGLDSGTASGRENVSKSAFSRMEVIVDDDLIIQHRIATILSRYDSLIENYQKQIKLLEEAAQRLYKEWFVDLHFPGHENTKIVDGVPEGWEKKKLGDITSKFATGLNPRKNFVLGHGNNFYVTIKNMANNDVVFDEKCDKVDDEALEKINKRSDLQQGDLLFSGIGTIGRVYLIDKPVRNWNISESVFTMRPNTDIPSTFLYLVLLDKKIQDYCQSNAHGCAQKGIRMADLKAFELLVPSKEILNSFSKVSSILIKQVKDKTSQIRLLTEARDHLLPKLMSGEIAV